MARRKRQSRRASFLPRSNSGLDAITVEIVDSSELTPDEQSDRLRLEKKVERAFYEAGKALQELKERRLYRSTHKSFEDYCTERFGYLNRRHPYRLIEAALVVDNLLSQCDQIGHIQVPIIPTNEAQARPLTALEPQQQWLAWQQAIRQAGGKVPSSRIVKDAVQRLQERAPYPNPFRVGEVCSLVQGDNPNLRGKGGCWCIVSEVGDFSCKVNTWDSEYLLRLEHLKSLNYSVRECRAMEELGVRMTQLYETGELDEAAMWVLNGLAKLTRPYLTPLEDKLLGVLEREYGIKK